MTSSPLIASDHPLSNQQRAALRRLAGLMIPASAEYGVPGADDDTVFADILRTVAPQSQLVSRALDELDALANGAFAESDPASQSAASESFRTSGSPLVGPLVALVTQCYYRDDRVMQSLEMEPRPPFPLGFELDNGDWSLLDPVRARGKLYRDAP